MALKMCTILPNFFQLSSWKEVCKFLVPYHMALPSISKKMAFKKGTIFLCPWLLEYQFSTKNVKLPDFLFEIGPSFKTVDTYFTKKRKHCCINYIYCSTRDANGIKNKSVWPGIYHNLRVHAMWSENNIKIIKIDKLFPLKIFSFPCRLFLQLFFANFHAKNILPKKNLQILILE